MRTDEMKSSASKIVLDSYESLFGTDTSTDDPDKVRMIPLDELYTFKGHPFRVLDDERMYETTESVRKYGVLVPGIARIRPEGGYEIISGHRRKRACELAGINEMPMFIRDYSDDEATVVMVDANIQILPTMSIYDEEVFDIPEEPSNILFMICLQLLKAVSDPCEYEEIKVRFQCGGYRFTAGGKKILKKGYRAFEKGGTGSDGSDPEEDTGTLPATDIREGMIFHKVKARYEQRSTRAPRPYTEDILLAAMESAGRGEFDDDTERKGLGTPATRAAVIERLISCGYARREGRIIRATEDGKILVGLMPEILTSAKLTADWENALLQMEKGKADPASFMDGIREMIMKILEECRKVPAEERSRFQAVETAGNCPVCGSPVCIGKKNYYCSNRECGFVIWRDLAFIRSMKKMVDDKMAEELLAKGKTYIRDLYSSKTKKTFPATLVMKVADGKAQFSLEFPHKDQEQDEKTGKDGKKRNFKW